MRPRHLLPGQHFHLYLIAYGLFRLVHEALRDTPPMLGPFSGYQVLALVMVAFGVERYWRRRRSCALPASEA